MITFNTFKLLNSLNLTLKEKGLSQPTDIQKQLIPKILEGQSVVGVAETGSGKTLAYALPILHILKNRENDKDPVIVSAHPRALIIVPTRELGEQVSKVFKLFTHTTRLRVRSVLGGSTLEVAKKNVAGPFEILVATPGRLLKLAERGLVNFSDVQILVYDEVDQMLDHGFLPDAKRIASQCPHSKQMLLLSATVSPAVESLMNQVFSGAEFVRSEAAYKIPQSLVTIHREIKDGKRLPILEKVLKEKCEGGTLIFANTREQCDKLELELTKLNLKCALYRGEMDKQLRRNNLKAFRDGSIGYLISTDLASRGLDVEHVNRVINYHLPQEIENYIHRAGRTARAGRKGTVINFVTERDAPLIRELSRMNAAPPLSFAGKKPRSY